MTTAVTIEYAELRMFVFVLGVMIYSPGALHVYDYILYYSWYNKHRIGESFVDKSFVLSLRYIFCY